MSQALHIIERFFFHFPWAILMVGMLAYAEIWSTERFTKVGPWLSTRFTHALVNAALIVGLVMPAREWWDIWRGNQVWYKTPFDYASWYLGAAAGVWVFYRLHNWILSRKSQ